MKKRARSILTGLLVLCCAVAGLVPAVHVKADSSSSAGRNIIVIENADPARMAYPLAVSTQTAAPVESPSSGPWQTTWAWIQNATRSTGTWIAEATHWTGTWIQNATRSTGAFIAALYTSIRDFFVSGQALNVLQTATQAITDLAVRLFLPLSVLVMPILGRTVSGLSVTPELVAVWMFWIVVVLALIVLILALRPRHNVRKRLPRVSPRTAGQGQNTIEFGLVEQGPKPSASTPLDQLAQTQEKLETPPVQEPAAQPAIAEESSHAWLDSRSVPEISLEPLGFFAGAGTIPTTVPAVPAAMITSAEPPLLEFTPPEAESPTTEGKLSEPVTATPAVPADVPSEALLTPPQEPFPVQEQPPETLLEPFPEPELTPMGPELSVQSVESESNVSETMLPVDQPMPAEESSVPPEALQEEEISVPEVPAAPQAGSIEEPVSTEEMSTPVHEEVSSANETVPVPEETSEVAATPEATPVGIEPVEQDHESLAAELSETKTLAPSGADLLSRLLDDEESFERTVVAAGATAAVTAPVPPFAPAPANTPAPQPSVFSGDAELDTLLQDGVVTDAGALAQLFRGGYRNRISKLAVSAKDLQNVPEEMRQVIRLTVVALSPIELSIARDLAMRLEAPGFVGEALLVAKKMGYENYLTTYKNISKNYKDVSIIDIASLKAPEISAESGEDLISFS